MNPKWSLLWLGLVVCALPVQAADETKKMVGTDVSTGTISGATWLSPGRYVSSIAPQLNGDMANQLKKALAKVPGIESPEASATDSAIRFTVKKDAKIQLAELQRLIAKVDAGAVMTAPVLENSLTPRPGF